MHFSSLVEQKQPQINQWGKKPFLSPSCVIQSHSLTWKRCLSKAATISDPLMLFHYPGPWWHYPVVQFATIQVPKIRDYRALKQWVCSKNCIQKKWYLAYMHIIKTSVAQCNKFISTWEKYLAVLGQNLYWHESWPVYSLI